MEPNPYFVLTAIHKEGHMVRYYLPTLLIVLAFIPVSRCAGDESYEIMRRLLSNAELVILGDVESVGGGIAHEAHSHISMECRIKIIDLIQGKSPTSKTILAYVDILSDHPAFPKKGDKRVFLLRPDNRDDPKYFSTDDIRFCIQPASMARELKILASEMAAQQKQKPNP